MLIKVTEETKTPTDGDVSKYVEYRTIDAVIGCTSRNVWEDYCEFCKKRGYTTRTHIDFMHVLCAQFNVKACVKRLDGNTRARVVYRK